MQIGSNPLVDAVVGIVLFLLGRRVIHWVAKAEQNPWLVKILTWCLVLHLLAAPAQVFIVSHIYHGIADWTRYTHQGAAVADNFRHFHFNTNGTNVGKIVNDGSVSIATGVVMTIVGNDLTAAFLVFGWLSFVGCVFYYRAFTITFAGAGYRRYAYFVFLLPSDIFWTSDASKEAIMFFALSLVAYGGARAFRGRPGGYTMMAPGVALGALVRPNELILLMGGFAVAMTVRVASGSGTSGFRRFFGFCFGGLLFFLSIVLTQHYLVHNGSLGGQLQTTHTNNVDVAGASSGGVPYSSSPATYPRDVYEVLLNPLPFNAHGSSQLIAAFENVVLLGLILASFRQLRVLIRASISRKYVMQCLVYSVGFMYAFAALGNLGLIERERTMVLPFLLVLLCIPRAPKRAPPLYEWELKRRDRRRLQPLLAQTDGVLPVRLRTSLLAPGSAYRR